MFSAKQPKVDSSPSNTVREQVSRQLDEVNTRLGEAVRRIQDRLAKCAQLPSPMKVNK